MTLYPGAPKLGSVLLNTPFSCAAVASSSGIGFHGTVLNVAVIDGSGRVVITPAGTLAANAPMTAETPATIPNWPPNSTSSVGPPNNAHWLKSSPGTSVTNDGDWANTSSMILALGLEAALTNHGLAVPVWRPVGSPYPGATIWIALTNGKLIFEYGPGWKSNASVVIAPLAPWGTKVCVLKKNLSPATSFPPTVIPPTLSATYGWVNSPPPACDIAPARIFGKEFSCPAINKELSIKPDAFEAPRETYELKSADPESPT